MKTLFIAGLLFLASSRSFSKTNNENFSAIGQLHFIENKGQIIDQFRQTRHDIQFSLHGKDVNVFIGNGNLHYQFSKVDNKNLPHSENNKLGHPNLRVKNSVYVNMYRLDVSLLGANKKAKVVTEEKEQFTENYYLPACAEKGISANAYNKIIYKDIYPNIDWVIYTRNNQLEYDFLVREGGNPADIKIEYNGASSLNINDSGSLEAKTPMGTVIENAPLSYQASGSNVNTSFVLNKNILSIKVAKFTSPLTIDPSITWATYYGGTGEEQPNCVKGDPMGNVYICGATLSTANIATVGAHQMSYQDGNMYGDAFIAKFNSSGTMQWATYYGGSGDDAATGLSIDNAGNIYVTGQTLSSTNIATPGSYQPNIAALSDTIPPTTYDAFLVKFNSAGIRQWGTYYGGPFDEYCTGISCDNSGNLYIAGLTRSLTGISTPGSYQDTMNEDYNSFLAKFTNTGNRVWATYFGANLTGINAVTNDNSNNVIIGGMTISHIGIATANGYQTTYMGSTTSGGDGFIAKFDSTGAIQWGTYYGGIEDDAITALSTDAQGNIFVGGNTSSSGLASAGAYQTSLAGGYDPGDVILIKFNSNGTRDWATYFGGQIYTGVLGIANDPSGNVIIGGVTSSPFGLATPGAFQPNPTSNRNGFIARFSNAGAIAWASYLGGTDNDGVSSVYVDNDNDIYALLYANSSDLATPEAYQTVNNGNKDALLAKINDCRMNVDISKNGNILEAPDTIADCQWYRNDTTIEGANTPSYTATINGNYYFTGISGPDSCTVQSDTMYFALGVPSIQTKQSICIYPNPNNGTFVISGNISSEEKAAIEIIDMTGNTLIETESMIDNGHINKEIVLNNDIAAGIYMVRLTSGNTNIVIPFVKQ